MTDPDLQGFADLWTEPDAAEQEAFEAMARKARARGRILAYLDVAGVAVMVGGVLLSLFMEPGTLTVIAAIALLITTVIVIRKRRQIRQMTRALDTASREAFVETSIANAAANLRRARFTLVVFPIGVAIALVFKMSVRVGGRTDLILPAFLEWAPSLRGIITFVVLGLLFAWVVRTESRTRRELEALKEVRALYADEARREEAEAA
ncbi:MAG TPA: hypothetical protein VF759_01565 [Allosphingosinicella sp.]|jgi:hypothetical protein